MLANVEFTSKRKRASVVVKHTAPDGTEMARVYTKGAPDMLFPMLGGVLDSNMKLAPMDGQTSYDGEECNELEKLNKVVKKFADSAYRTILITKKDMSMDDFNKLKTDNNQFVKAADREVLELGGLEAIGIFGLQDPLRLDIRDSIALVNKAGI